MTSETSHKHRVLLVEDESLIAMLIEDFLLDLDCEVVATVGQFHEALDAARNGEFDLAFLDVNLHGRPVYPVAEILQQRGIPFAFVTGYGTVGLDAKQTKAPVLQKPFQARDLAIVINQLMQQSNQ